LPGPHRCRPQGSCPSRRFWPRARHARTLANPPSPWRPDASRPCFMPLAPLESPFRASLLEEPYPLSRASCFLAGSRSTNPTARHGPRDSRPLSPLRRPLAAACPKARRTGRPGRRFPGVARTLRVTRCRARLQRPRLGSAGLTGYGGRHARFEALLPSRVPSSRDHHPCGQRSHAVGALLGFVGESSPTSCPVGPASFPASGTLRVSPQGESTGCPGDSSSRPYPLEFSPAVRGFGLRVDERGPGRTRSSPALGSSLPGHMFARFALRPWGLEPTIHRRDRSIEPDHATVRRRPCLRTLSRSAHPPIASPVRVA